MDDLKWHCFEDPERKILCCVQADIGSKEIAAITCKKQIGLEYDHNKHIYSCWNSASFLCQKHNLDFDYWKKAEKFQIEQKHPYAMFENNDITVYFVSSTRKQETYGATCSGCYEMFPYAVTVENFKCWKCRHGL